MPGFRRERRRGFVRPEQITGVRSAFGASRVGSSVQNFGHLCFHLLNFRLALIDQSLFLIQLGAHIIERRVEPAFQIIKGSLAFLQQQILGFDRALQRSDFIDVALIAIVHNFLQGY